MAQKLMRLHTPPGTESLKERVLRWRNDLLANPRIQNLTVALPFLRPFANKRARDLFDLCTGFVHTQVVTACVELELLDILADGPKATSEIAARTNLPDDAAERLLLAATALELLVKTSDNRFRLGELGAALRGATGVTEMIRHNQVFYRDLQDPVKMLRNSGSGSQLSQYWPYAEGAPATKQLPASATADYSELMSATQHLIASDIMASYDLGRHRALLDVGGGYGTFAMTAARRHPSLRATALDIPSVAESANQQIAAAGLADRVEAHGSDFHRDPIPTGYDIVSLIRILLDHDDAKALNLLKKVKSSLAPDGRLLIAEIMSGARGAETISDAYFGLYLFAMGRGRPRTAAEIQQLLREAGFSQARPIRTRRSIITQLIVATP